MNTQALINDLWDRGVTLTPHRGKLLIEAPRGVLTDDLRRMIAENRDAIIGVRIRTIYIQTRIDRRKLELVNFCPDRFDWESTEPQALEAGRALAGAMKLYIDGNGALTAIDRAFRAWIKTLERTDDGGPTTGEREEI